MSREDPQFRVRLPIELKEKVEVAAKVNGRSLNAEIVHRLDVSFLNEAPTDELISAKDAIQIIKKAKHELALTVFNRTFAEINKKIRVGHTSFHVDLTDLNLEGLNESDFFTVCKPTFEKLRELGYEVPNSTLDDDGFLVVIP
ncbi:Arc family DNA-binding protein [Pantoea sp. FN060301]|uniref:Arc family DNA-binding protein n=1 Tax=Pantoea sp. FN060301 TaxID=3420380 RepID=UPI003D17E389